MKLPTTALATELPVKGIEFTSLAGKGIGVAFNGFSDDLWLQRDVRHTRMI